jgi:N-[(2S)-2-amino-2-carboxyethyl]-L-glutamate dehydrogenase
MLYLNEDHILKIGMDWQASIQSIEESAIALHENDFSQPVKPYLRYRNLVNRIIAMPAFVGKKINVAGIKWIASFPDNIIKGIKRANSVTILNKSETGEPFCIVNTALISAIRTSAVSGLLVKYYLERQRSTKSFTVGVTGFGPIAKTHINMLISLLGDKLNTIKVFDLKGIKETDIDANLKDNITIVESWQDAYADTDIFVTCTVSKDRYIDARPKKGSLLLNVSLRDFKTDILPDVDLMLVDDWNEICRENTDIEHMHKEKNLQEKDCHNISDSVVNKIIQKSREDETIMFNPMGMAIFDMAIAKQYYDYACENKIGIELPD